MKANMKVIFKMSVLLFFCLSSFAGLSGNGIQNPKDTLKSKVASITVIRKDSIPKNSININGKLNSVSIINGHSTQKNWDTDGKQKNISNSIEINGEGNSVNIHQNKNGGNVNIHQNGAGNKVNVSQSNSE